jgi:TRAP-type mannitol/chloroaromatic compound transport system permease large subunit
MARQRVLRNQIGECSAYYTVRSLARLVMIMVGLAAVVAVFWLFQRDRWMEMWIVSIVAFAFEVLFYALTIVVCDIADAHLLMRDELRLRQDFATKV